MLFKVFQSLNTSYTPDARPKTVMTTNTQSKAHDWNYTLNIREKMTMFTCTLFAVASIFSGLEKEVCMLQLLEYSYAQGNQHISKTLWYFYFIYLFILHSIAFLIVLKIISPICTISYQTSFQSFSAWWHRKVVGLASFGTIFILIIQAYASCLI